MKNATKIILSIISTVAIVWQVPAVQALISPLLASHPSIAGLVAAVGAVFAVLHVPTKTA